MGYLDNFVVLATLPCVCQSVLSLCASDRWRCTAEELWRLV